MPVEYSTLISLAVAISAVGVSYGATRQSIANLKERLVRLETRADSHDARVTSVEVAFARMETLLQGVIKGLEQLHDDLKKD